MCEPCNSIKVRELESQSQGKSGNFAKKVGWKPWHGNEVLCKFCSTLVFSGKITKKGQNFRSCFLASIHLTKHCVKSVRIRSYSGPYFTAFGLNADQKSSVYGHFLRSESETVLDHFSASVLSKFVVCSDMQELLLR